MLQNIGIDGGDLARVFRALANPARLKILRILGEIEGTKSCYCLNYGTLRQFRGWMNTYLADLPDGDDDPHCC